MLKHESVCPHPSCSAARARALPGILRDVQCGNYCKSSARLSSRVYATALDLWFLGWSSKRMHIQVSLFSHDSEICPGAWNLKLTSCRCIAYREAVNSLRDVFRAGVGNQIKVTLQFKHRGQISSPLTSSLSLGGIKQSNLARYLREHAE